MRKSNVAEIVIAVLATVILLCAEGCAENEGWMSSFQPSSADVVILDYIETQELFAALSDKTLIASSGAGAWEAQLNVDASGGFEGYYYDVDAGDEVMFACSFSGRFAANAEDHAAQYWLWVQELTTANTPGTEVAGEKGERIVCTEAPFEKDTFLVLTLIDTPTERIPETVREEIGGTFWEWEDYSRFITLTRLSDGWGFFADGYESNREELKPMIVIAPAPESTAEPAEYSVGKGTGFWNTADDTQGELVITANPDGTLHMQVFFLRTFEMEADLQPLDESQYMFETEYGHYYGTLFRAEDGSMRLAVTGGMSMEDDENEYYYLLCDQEHVFQPAQYSDLWYEVPTENPENETDWEGEWIADNGGIMSGMRITRDDQGTFSLQLFFSTGYQVTGTLENVDSRRKDFSTEDFGAILTLNRKHDAILMTDSGSMNDAANNALDAFHYVIEYNRKE